jgi:hypothetical protein
VLRVTEVLVRGFTEADRAALRALSGRVGDGSPTASLRGHEESEAAVHLTPYMDLEPDSLFVAVVDGAGQERVARCTATAPRARLRHATPVQPAAAMRRASAGWGDQSRIDSPRYA